MIIAELSSAIAHAKLAPWIDDLGPDWVASALDLNLRCGSCDGPVYAL